MNVIFRIFFFVSICLMVWSNHVFASDWQTAATETESLIMQAKTAGGLWRDTEKLLEQAKELQTNGNLQEAYELLYIARQQAELGHQQATGQLENYLIPYYLKH